MSLALLLQLLVAPAPAEALGWRLPGQGAAAASRPGGESARRQLQEVPPPARVQQAREALEERDPRVRILAPADGDLLPDGPWTLRLQVTDWPLLEAGSPGPGPHLVVQLDGEPPRPTVDTAVEMPPLSPGSHRLTVYAAKPWGEAHKSPLALQQIRLHRLAANPATLPAPGTPQLIPVSPAGLAGDPPLLLDWLLIDAPLQGLRGDASGWRLRLTVNGESVLVDQQTPLWLQGWKPGSNALLLELLDGRGEPLNPPFNSLLQEVIVPASGAGGSPRARSAPTADLERAGLLEEQPASVLFPGVPDIPATALLPASPEVADTAEVRATAAVADMAEVADMAKIPVTAEVPASPDVPVTQQGPAFPDVGRPWAAPPVSAPAPTPEPRSEPSQPASLPPVEELDREGAPTAPDPPSSPTATSAATVPDAQGPSASSAGVPSAEAPASPAATIHPPAAAVPPAPVVQSPFPTPAPTPAPLRTGPPAESQAPSPTSLAPPGPHLSPASPNPTPSTPTPSNPTSPNPTSPTPGPSALAPTALAAGTTAGFGTGEAAEAPAEDATSPAAPPATAALPPAAVGPPPPPPAPPPALSAFGPSMPPAPPATDPPMAARAEVNVDGTLRRPAPPDLLHKLRERLGR